MSGEPTRLPVFELHPGVKIVGLGLYIEEYKMLVVSDLHLGYEQVLSERGLHLPAVQLQQIKRVIRLALKRVECERLVVAGDVKHEFGSALKQEWSEVLDLFEWLKGFNVRVEVVRGNHDNFLIPILRRLNIPLYDPYLRCGRYVIIHGHKPLPLDVMGASADYVIMGHEHPAIVVRDELGIKMKFKCFLEGSINGARLVVLPALSPLMPGTEVNVVSGRRLLSPILQAVGVDSFRVYVVDLAAGIFDFGTVGFLRSVLGIA